MKFFFQIFFSNFQTFFPPQELTRLPEVPRPAPHQLRPRSPGRAAGVLPLLCRHGQHAALLAGEGRLGTDGGY